MSTTSILEYRHPVDGEIRIDRIGEQVRLVCRWPADLSEDEWIELSNRFNADVYSQEIRRLNDRKATTIHIPGERHGELVLSITGDGRVEIDAVDGRSAAPPRVIMKLDLAPEAFLPS